MHILFFLHLLLFFLHLHLFYLHRLQDYCLSPSHICHHFFLFTCLGSSQTYQCLPVSSRLMLCCVAFATGMVLHLASQQMLCCISRLYCLHLKADDRRGITNQSVSYHEGMGSLLSCWQFAQSEENLLMTSPHRYLRAVWGQKRREEKPHNNNNKRLKTELVSRKCCQ